MTVPLDPGLQIRTYTDADEQSWLRCRVLSFLGTCYYDDVAVTKRDRDALVQLVAVIDGEVVGQLDAVLGASQDGCDATLENIAVHPDHTGRGIATALLAAATDELVAAGAHRIQAWTREDTAALAWYARTGFAETFRYLHVYSSLYTDDLADPAFVSTFAHAPIERESELRAAHRRVYLCRRLELDLE